MRSNMLSTAIAGIANEPGTISRRSRCAALIAGRFPAGIIDRWGSSAPHMGMRGSLCAALAALLIAAVGCSGGSNSNDASTPGAAGSSGGGTTGAAGASGTTGAAGTTGGAGRGGTTAAGGGGGATGGAGGGATNAACQAIRICALDCANEACIMNNCKPMGTPAAQAAFQALYDCTLDPARGNCPDLGDVNCMCMAQYLQDPPCADPLSDCIGNINDVIADRCF